MRLFDLLIDINFSVKKEKEENKKEIIFQDVFHNDNIGQYNKENIKSEHSKNNEIERTNSIIILSNSRSNDLDISDSDVEKHIVWTEK